MNIDYVSSTNRLNDIHYKKLFKDCVDIVGQQNCDYAYLFVDDVKKLNKQVLEKKLVLIAIRDHLHAYKDQPGQINYEQLLIDLANKHPEKLFVIFLEYFDTAHVIQFEKIKNIRIILWYGNLTDDLDKYCKVVPAKNKNFETIYPAVCLNRYARPHRLVLLSYIYGIGIEQHAYLSFQKLNDKINFDTELLDLVDWEFSEDTKNIQQIIKQGFKRIFLNKDTLVNDEKTYSTVPNTEMTIYYSNAQNFQDYLCLKYSNSLIEIISETLYNTPYGSVSEKFLNSVYGCNFPILIAVPGAVKFLRNLGFDMFDDIIDHSYDNIDDDLKRIESAIQRNIHLITNKNLLITHWKNNIVRFDNNLDFVKNQLPNIIYNKVIDSFKQCIKLQCLID